MPFDGLGSNSQAETCATALSIPGRRHPIERPKKGLQFLGRYTGAMIADPDYATSSGRAKPLVYSL